MADEIPATTAPVPDVPIIPETEAEQQAKQQASLSPEELAQLEAEQEEARKKQEEEEERHRSLTLEGLDERLDDLCTRVEAIEQAASSSSSSSKSSSSSTKSDSGSTKSTSSDSGTTKSA